MNAVEAQSTNHDATGLVAQVQVQGPNWSQAPFKGGCVEADPFAMWIGICFITIVTVVYFFFRRDKNRI
ncbi:MAG: hypothetical protein J7M25_17235 [Deltaproteobacteria bacterium]|nr:hypothetical protein [Deltaproteobacteria bacterium]